MRIMLDDGAFWPVREHPTDAGMDIRAMYSGIVRAGQGVTFRTGVHIELPPGTAGLFVSKSGLMMKHDITSTGLVDETHGGVTVEMKMTVGEFFARCCKGFEPEVVEAIPVEWLKEKTRHSDNHTQASAKWMLGCWKREQEAR